MKKKKVHEENLIIIAISACLTMNHENNQIMVELIKKYSPSYWELLNPDGYYVYYLNNSMNDNLSSKLYEQIIELIKSDKRFSEFKIGMSTGQMIVSYDKDKKIIDAPLGIAANEALNNQVGIEDIK